MTSTGTDTGTARPVLVEYEDGVQIVTINRPEVRNAINTAAAQGIADAMAELDARDDLVASVITGAGTTFCAGMDLKAFLQGERPSIEGRGFAGLTQCPPAKPLIAAVEGHAIAGGFEIVLACDLVVAATNATFGLPEVKRGLLAGGGGLLRLPHRIPYHVAMEWILTGDLYPATAAHAYGLVNRLAEPGRAREAGLELARAVAKNGPLALRASKQIVTASRDWSTDEQFARQQEIYEPVRSSQDAREGATAFKERRPPKWRGQ